MKLIKLDAIDSTNDFLKNLSSKQFLENFTVVTAENQTKGRGQMGTVWNSEKGKNLIMSVLVRDFIKSSNQIFDLNILFTVSIIQVLDDLNLPNISIKWPNDIMSGQKKIGGILIENSIKYDNTIQSIVGFGLNVNQINFENLPNATSILNISNIIFNKDEILSSIVKKLNFNYKNWKSESLSIKTLFSNRIFKKGGPVVFQNQNQTKFMGIIVGVSAIGKLEVLLENESVALFDTKEIQMIY